jgi:membrane-associated protease RseP (regulator of RpoE activity)
MSLLYGWIIFLAALVISVTLHEAGHLLTAKKFGMKATQFFAGFGPTLFSRQRGETEYGIKILPFGGFVKIIGMTSLEEVDPADEPRSFRRQAGWKRLIVLAAGSFMHFVLAFVLLIGLFAAIGQPNSNSTTVGQVLGCVPSSAQAACKPGEATSPAAAAGLRSGDKIVAFNGKPAGSWTTLSNQIKSQRAGSTATLTVQRAGRDVTVKTKLSQVNGRPGGYLGVSPAIVYQRAGPIGAVTSAGSFFGQVVTGSVAAVGQFPKAVPNLFSHNRSSTAGGQVTSIVGAGDFTGQVLGASIGWQTKVSFAVLIIVSLNIFVGLFNLLPLLPMDGGHIAAVAYERLRAYVARLRGRADPGLVDMKKLLPVSFGVFAIIVFFGLMLIFADLINPVNIIQ